MTTNDFCKTFARLAFISASVFVCAGSQFIHAQDATGSERTVIVVVGTGGEEKYESLFAEWGDKWATSAQQPGTNVVRISPPETVKATSQVSCKEQLQAEITSSIKRNDSELWIVLIGHGTYNGRAAKFNLAGPDVSAQEMGMWLLDSEMPLAVINCASSSAPFINALSGPNRVIVTATKSGVEQNFCRFGGFLADLITNPTADLDKDGQTSLLEAWLMAARQTAEFYTSESRLATEHALLDDDANMRGSREDSFSGVRPIRDPKSGAKDSSVDGYRAHQFCLKPSDRERDMPAGVKAKRDQIELAVINLRDRKSEMNEDQYFEKLEGLLLQLAVIYEDAQ